MILTALLLAAAPTPTAPSTPALPADCRPPPVGKQIPFSTGETLEYEFNALGATLGGVTLSVLPGRQGQPFLVEARGKTGAFASNFHAVDAVASSLLSADLQPLSYMETSTEAGVHFALDTVFPPVQGKLQVRASREGERSDLQVSAPQETRDIVSALYAVRGMTLTPGQEICFPAFVSRRVWLLRVKVDGREKAGVPLGEFSAIKISGSATRLDNPAFKRDVHFWYSDDANRLPLAACGSFQGKPTCANLKAHTPGKKRLASGPRR